MPTTRKSQNAPVRHLGRERRARRGYGVRRHPTAIGDLNAKVNALARSVDNAKQWAQYKCPNNGNADEAFPLISGQWVIRELMRPHEWDQMFQASSEVDNSNKFRLTSCKMNIFLSPDNSTLSLTPKLINVYLVSLKAATSAQFLEDTDQFNRVEMDNSEGKYWEGTNSIGGADVSMPILSPAVFNIHMHKRIILQNIVEETASLDPDEDTDVTAPNFTHKMINKVHKMDCLLKTADNKKWKDLEPHEIKDTKRLYLLFYQGGFVDALNTVTVGSNIIFTGRGTN